jgi:hypothetical protein
MPCHAGLDFSEEISMHGFWNRGLFVPNGRFAEAGRFGRMFPYLRSLTAFQPGVAALGKPGGPMDGGSPPPTDTSQENPRIKAGYTFLGQFIDHDMTFDVTSVLEQQIDPHATRNFRTPVLELDSLYGQGPGAQPYLFDSSGIRFLLGANGNDLPRSATGRAIIGDPRNDENIIVSQLHLLFMKFHNKVVDEATDSTQSGPARFEAAQTLVRWHYQWIVWNEFLPRFVDAAILRDAIERQPFLFRGQPFMPVEFSIAAYRFGHSQVRPGYLLSRPGAQPVRAASIFNGEDRANDLHGGRPVPDGLRVEWAAFFGQSAIQSMQIDVRLSSALMELPASVVPQADTARSLAARNLQRGIDARLPSGQAVARHLRIPVVPDDKLWQGVENGKGQAPLWFYLLREAEVEESGQMLAGVGATIVARVFAALLLADKASFMVQAPDWTPTLPSSRAGRFSMSDLVNFTLGDTLEQEDLDLEV